VAISADSSTAVSGAIYDENRGSAWIFSQAKYTGVLSAPGDPLRPEQPRSFHIAVPGGNDIVLSQCGSYDPVALVQHLGQVVTATGQLLSPAQGGGICASGFYVPPS